MADDVRDIQLACDDLFCDPDDDSALRRVLQVLGADTQSRILGEVVSRRDLRRLVRIACEELHDDLADTDARNRLLVLIAASSGGGGPETRTGRPMSAA